MRLSFVNRLQAAVGLGEPEIEALRQLAGPLRSVEARTVLIDDGEPHGHGILLVSGWAMRCRVLADGRRQIIRFLLPGDLCDPMFFVPRHTIHAIETITPAVITTFTSRSALALFERWPRIAAGFWFLAGQDQAELQDRITALGRCSAYERMADLIWQLWRRLEIAGLTVENRARFPLTQALLGDALGLSVVHVNRTLRAMREDGLIEIRDETLLLRNIDALAAVVHHISAAQHCESVAGSACATRARVAADLRGRSRAG